jgi:hypothetical protein
MSALFDPNLIAMLVCVVGWSVVGGLGAAVTAAVRFGFEGLRLIAGLAVSAVAVVVALAFALATGADPAVLGVLAIGAVGAALMGVGAAVVGYGFVRWLKLP